MFVPVRTKAPKSFSRVLATLALAGALCSIAVQDSEAQQTPPDSYPPTISITSPASGTTYTIAQTVTITASASDNVGVTKVEFYDGAVLKGTAAAAPYRCAWAITSLQNGAHNWTAKAYDAANNSRKSPGVSLTVNIPVTDTTPPSVSISSPVSGTTYTSAQTVTITASASDNVGVTKLEFYDGGVLKRTATTAPYTYTWPITSLVNGTHSWTAKAYDAANNTRTSTAVSLTVNIPDTTAPTVSITSPVSGTTYTNAQTVTITASASDNVGVRRVEFYDGGVLKGTATVSPYAFAWPITSLANGTHSWTAKAYDAANNSATSAAVSITVSISIGTIPLAPTALTATALSSNEINLSWTDNSTNESGFKMERATSTDSWVQIGTTGASGTSFPDTSVAASSAYFYRVRATNATGDSAYSNTTSATTPASGAYAWSKAFGGSTSGDAAQGRSIATDPNGNVFVAGTFTGNINFGAMARTTTGSALNVFLLKISSSGNLQWLQTFGGSSDNRVLSIATDRNGDVLVAGSFSGTTDLGGGPILSAGYYDGFVAKYAGSNGAHIWSKSFGSTSMAWAMGVAVDSTGSVFVTGYFQGTANFGGGPLASGGNNDIFLAKYSASGSPVWSKRLGGAGSDVAESVAVDGSGNTIIVGSFQGTVDFGGGPLVSAGGNDIFVAKFSSAGIHAWSKRFGSTTGETAHSVAASGSDEIVITGEFPSSVDFGAGPLVNTGGADTYLAAFNASGVAQWSKRFGTNGILGSTGQAVSMDAAGNIALTGTIVDLVDFGGGSLGPLGSYDPYVAKFTSLGTHVWSRRFAGAYDDHGQGIAIDASGNVVFTGDFYDVVDFGGGSLTSPWPSGTDGFVSKYGP